MWQHRQFPGKAATRYDYEQVDGRPSVTALSNASASMLHTAVQMAPERQGLLGFSWKIPGLIAGSDLGRRDSDDSPVRIVLAFDGDRSRFSAKDAALSEVARLVTGEEMPYATLMYVWCNRRPAGTVVAHPRSDRIRSIVVESGPSQVGHWMTYERDIRADFERAFGEAPGMLVGVGLMTDSDNTGTHAQASYGPLRFGPGPLAVR